MSFNVRHFLRHIRKDSLRLYCDSRGATVPAEWWDQSEFQMATVLADYLVQGEGTIQENILAELIRVDAMSSERGRTAMLAAAHARPEIPEQFGSLPNDHERALFMLMTHDALFREAEERQFFDYQSEGRSGRHFRGAKGRAVSRELEDLDAFKTDICAFHRKRDGSGLSCGVEFVDRLEKDAVQIAIYVQGLINQTIEFVAGRHTRRISNTAIAAAIVYSARDGTISTVAAGGKDVHEMLRQALARRLLKVEPRFDVVRPRRFLLDTLSYPKPLAADPALGARSARVRSLRMAPPGLNSGTFTVEAPAGEPDVSAYDLSAALFAEGHGVFRNQRVLKAVIAIQLHPEPGRKKGKTLNLELALPNASNLRRLTAADRRIAEAHIEKWGLIEPVPADE